MSIKVSSLVICDRTPSDHSTVTMWHPEAPVKKPRAGNPSNTHSPPGHQFEAIAVQEILEHQKEEEEEEAEEEESFLSDVLSFHCLLAPWR